MGEGMGYRLNDLIKGAKSLDDKVPFADIFVPGTLEQNKAPDGSIYLVPYILITVAFWYDNRIFEKAGVSDPATWQDFMRVCEKIKQSGVTAVAADGQADQYLEMYFYHLAQRFEGSGFLLKAAEDKTGAAWGHPSIKKSLDMCAEVRDKYFIEGWEGFVWPAGQMELAVGNAAMELCGSWLPNELKTATDPDFDWGGFAFPAVSGGKGKKTDMEAYLLSWMIMKNAPHPKEAFHFINFCMNKKNQIQMVNESLNASARKGLAWPDVIKDGEQMFAKATSTFEGLDWIQSKHAEYFTTIFRPTLRQFWHRQTTADGFISKMKQQTIQFWKNR
jgi:raffinose/stachyose/melibiose transport system substrate-binding protein